jgi:hypothetical protein
MFASIYRSAQLSKLLNRRCWLALLAVIGVLVTVSWWLTEPLAHRGPRVAFAAATPPSPIAAELRAEVSAPKRASLEWPQCRLEGMPAKHVLLDALLVAQERLNHVDTYTATFRRQERIAGHLGPEETAAMKVRNRPFAIYLKFFGPHCGREAVYAEGYHDNKVIVHGVGVARLLVPRLALAPDHPLARADSRHAVTEAGLANLTDRLIGYRRMDLTDADASTVLGRVTDENGNCWLTSVHIYGHQKPERPFARVEVRYDPDTFVPIDIRSYDWPAPGASGTLLLAERYSYENLDLNAALTALDFDPANPNYAFHRY